LYLWRLLFPDRVIPKGARSLGGPRWVASLPGTVATGLCYSLHAKIYSDHTLIVLIQDLARTVWRTPKTGSDTPRTRHSARFRRAAQPSSSVKCRGTCIPWVGAVWNSVRLHAKGGPGNRRSVKHVRAERNWSPDSPDARSAAAWAP